MDLVRIFNNITLLNQFKFIEKSHFRKIPRNIVNNFFSEVKKYLIKTNEPNDNDIYAIAIKIFKPYIKQFSKTNDNRAKFRAEEIVNIIKIHPNNFLDFGCGNGSITYELGKLLNIENETYGVDIYRDKNLNSHIKFSLITNDILPFPDDNFDFILSLMALHHVENLKKALEEIYRVLKFGGLLLIREHDCNSKETASLLDAIHGFYDKVWSEGNIIDIYADYKSMDEWDKIIEEVGFNKMKHMLICWDKMKVNSCTYMRCYYQGYMKTL